MFDYETDLIQTSLPVTLDHTQLFVGFQPAFWLVGLAQLCVLSTRHCASHIAGER